MTNEQLPGSDLKSHNLTQTEALDMTQTRTLQALGNTFSASGARQ